MACGHSAADTKARAVQMTTRNGEVTQDAYEATEAADGGTRSGW